MAYWKTEGKDITSIESFGLGNTVRSEGAGGEFYEIEPAVVLDIILNENHPIFQLRKNLQTNLDVDRWPADFEGKKPIQGELDFTWVGRALIRLLYSTPTVSKDNLIWAYPLDYSVSEYPLINEVVGVYVFRGRYFYTRRLNDKNLPNESVDFAVNEAISSETNTELYKNEIYSGVKSQTKFQGGFGYEGVAGKYYKINNRIRAVKRYEGDLIFESRFGQSIIFRAYDKDRDNDIGDSGLTSYKDGGGNPMIIIRNRQRKLLKKTKETTEELKLISSPNEAIIKGTIEEKNAGGFIEPDINHDGSSIYITSGQTISKWVTTCYKKMFGVDEEVSSFKGKTVFEYPTLNGEQMVFNTDRIILSSRSGEIFQFAKKRYSIVTDGEYTVDAHNQVVITTHTKTVINSPAIYLGEYDQTGEPVLLGQTTVNWLYDMCNWLLAHTHWYIHAHKDAGKESPSQTQLPVQAQKLIVLRDSLHTLLSRRVFVTGGGFAPGQNGANITNGSSPVKIQVSSGGGVPGGWKGANKR